MSSYERAKRWRDAKEIAAARRLIERGVPEPEPDADAFIVGFAATMGKQMQATRYKIATQVLYGAIIVKP